MMLKDFFEGNSISMDVMEAYDEFRLDCDKKRALRKVSRMIIEEYADEMDRQIVGIMSVYYCGLQKGIIDEKTKNQLEVWSLEHISEFFEQEEAESIYRLIQELLLLPPVKQERPKMSGNVGSKKWMVGDLYAYSLEHIKTDDVNFEGTYAIIHCLEKKTVTNRQMDVTLYVRLCSKDAIQLPLPELLENSFYVPSYFLDRIYRYYLVSSHWEYPTDQLKYLGNVSEYLPPKNEYVPPNQLYIPRLVWQRFEEIIAHDYFHLKKKTGKDFLINT